MANLPKRIKRLGIRGVPVLDRGNEWLDRRRAHRHGESAAA
jgi:hypothetical protein